MIIVQSRDAHLHVHPSQASRAGPVKPRIPIAPCQAPGRIAILIEPMADVA